MAGEQHWYALCLAVAYDAGSDAWLRHGSAGSSVLSRSRYSWKCSWQCYLAESAPCVLYG